MSLCYCSFSPELEQEGLMLVQEVMLGSLRAMRAGVRHTQHTEANWHFPTRRALLFSFFNAHLPSVPAPSKNRGTLRSSVEWSPLFTAFTSGRSRKLLSSFLHWRNQDSSRMLPFVAVRMGEQSWNPLLRLADLIWGKICAVVLTQEGNNVGFLFFFFQIKG